MALYPAFFGHVDLPLPEPVRRNDRHTAQEIGIRLVRQSEHTVHAQQLEARLAEIVREKALAVTRPESPHSIAVLVEELEETDTMTTVRASLIVERGSQKGIVIGKGGETLKAIGSRAREEMELVLGRKVFLDVRVKVLKEWQRDPKALQRLGF